MTAFTFQPTVPNATAESGALGTGGANVYKSDYDLGKPVKYSTANNFVLCSDGDDIDGFIYSIEPFTVNAGYSFGSVLTEGRFVVEVAAGSAQLAVRDLVIAAAQTAIGTAGTPKVKKQATPAAGHKYWQVIRIISGTGVAGDSVLIQDFCC